MKAKCVVAVCVLFFIGLPTAFATNGKQLFDAYKANEKKMESSLKSMIMNQTMEGHGMVSEMTIYKKAEKMRMESVVKKSSNPMMGKAGEKSIMINDGKKSWSFSPMMGKVAIPDVGEGDDTRTPQSVKDLGKETVSGIACRKIEVMYTYGEKEILWISEKDSVLVKEENGDAEDKTVIVYSDFKTVSGYPMAHLIKTYENGQLTDTVRVTSLDINKRIDDTLFNPDLVKGYGSGKSDKGRKRPAQQGDKMEDKASMDMMQMAMEIQRLYQNGEVEKAKALEKKMKTMMQ